MRAAREAVAVTKGCSERVASSSSSSSPLIGEPIQPEPPVRRFALSARSRHTDRSPHAFPHPIPLPQSISPLLASLSAQLRNRVQTTAALSDQHRCRIIAHPALPTSSQSLTTESHPCQPSSTPQPPSLPRSSPKIMSADLFSSAFASFVEHRRAASSVIPSFPLVPSSPTSNTLPKIPSTDTPTLSARIPHPNPFPSQGTSSQPPLKRIRGNPAATQVLPALSSTCLSAVFSPVSVVYPSTLASSSLDSLARIAVSPASPPQPNLPLYQYPPMSPTSFSPLHQKVEKHPIKGPPENNSRTLARSKHSESVATPLLVPLNMSTDFLPPASNISEGKPLLAANSVSDPRKSDVRTPSSFVVQGGTFGGDCTFVCNLCGTRKTSKEELKLHKREHGRPFACSAPDCTASFSKANHLSRHVRIVHNKERPFACDEPGCGSRFGSKSHLGDHKSAVHMRLRNFKCRICNASWSKRFNLEKHIRICHLREKPFRCALCRMPFGTRSHVTRHELKVHKRATVVR